MTHSWTLDGATERAWTGFRQRLADHVAAMGDDDVLIVEVEPADPAPGGDDLGGSEPSVQFLGFGGGWVCAEVSSNAWLRPQRRLDDDAVAALAGLGWTVPGADDEDNFSEEAPTGDADRLAVMAVSALRDVFGVPHPAFLRAEGLEAGDDTRRYVEHDAGSSSLHALDEPAATRPIDRDELVDLVDRALTPVFGHEPQHDEDGDIPVTAGTAMVFVRVREDMPVVEIFCRVVHGIEDPEGALFEVNELNNEHPLISFAVVGDAVMADLHVPALPFAPAHLRDMLEVMCTSVDRAGPVLARRMGGSTTYDPVTDDADAQDVADVTDLTEVRAEPHAVRVLRQLDLDTSGTLSPTLVAQVCDWDRDLVLHVVEWCESSPQDRAAHWLPLARRALRLVVERRAERRMQGSGHRSRDRDVSLPGLDDLTPEGPGLFEAGSGGR